MSIPPKIVATARIAWRWQWSQLMNGLAPSDQGGNYCRPPSQAQTAIIPSKEDLLQRSKEELPILIIGRSCPWAHRTWLIYELNSLQSSLNLLIASPDYEAGIWKLEPSWMGCKTLLEIYNLCNAEPIKRATVPALIDPGKQEPIKPKLLGNESAQLVEAINYWSTKNDHSDLYPKELNKEINQWQNLLQENVNNGVYKCGFARNQTAYESASENLFKALRKLDESLSIKGPWICGKKLTLADIRLFPTIIRWEAIYAPLFKCTEKSLSEFPNILRWRKDFFNIPGISNTCDVNSWRKDYFGALFPLNPSNIIPKGPNIKNIVNSI